METIIGAGGAPGGNGGPGSADLVKDITQAEFAADVIQGSMQQPVIVDFWAPWCGPCKQLGPALEKAVTQARGAVRMVKINVDENQELAAQLRVQSIPTVYAFFQGQPVDAFQGAQPESQVKAFVEGLVKRSGGEMGADPISQAIEQAQTLLDGGQIAEAAALFGQVLQHDAENLAALAGLIACDLASGAVTDAREKFDSLTDEMTESDELSAIRAQLEMAEKAAEAGPVNELRAKVEQNPADHQSRLDLAVALQASGQREAAVDELLETIRRDREWNDAAARKQLLEFFDAWGPTDPLTIESRRRLSSLLFS